MTRRDPVADDDHLIDELLAGRAVEDPILAGLAAWRSDVAEAERAPLPADPVSPLPTQAAASVPADAGRTLPHRAPFRATPERGSHRHRAGRAGIRTRRAGAIGVGAAVLLAMGVGQAVAGSPVAPFKYVVARAVGFGEGVASPDASDARAPLTPSTPSHTPPILHGGRAGAEALTTTRDDDVATSAPSKDGRGRSNDPRDKDPETSKPEPPPGTAPTPGPTDPVPSPVPDQPSPSDPGSDDGDQGDHGHGHGRGDDSDRGRGDDSDRGRDRSGDGRDQRSWRPWYVVS